MVKMSANARFNHQTTTLTSDFQIDGEVKEAISEILKRIENYMKEGSGWIFDKARSTRLSET